MNRWVMNQETWKFAMFLQIFDQARIFVDYKEKDLRAVATHSLSRILATSAHDRILIVAMIAAWTIIMITDHSLFQELFKGSFLAILGACMGGFTTTVGCLPTPATQQ